MVRVHFGPPLLEHFWLEAGSEEHRGLNGTRKPALGDMPGHIATGVAFPQKSESILAHHFLTPPLLKKRLTEIPRELEISLSLLKKKLRPYLEN